MAEMLVPNDGAKGIDITRPDGSVQKLDADKSGKITVEDRSLIKALKDEGFTMKTIASITMNVEGTACTNCGFKSVFKKFVCPKCEVANDHRN
jgi:hypothetical protein